MEPDRPAASTSSRPRPWLLVLLGIVVVAALVMKLGGSATPGAPASNPARRTQQQQGAARLDPAKLDVKLDALAGERPGPGDSDRNPFGFKPKPPPPPPPVDPGERPIGRGNGPPPPPPPTVAPITVKFIGIITAPDGRQIASFTDCRLTYQVYEGKEFAGQYRLVKIGVESVVVERIDGSGRTTLPMSGQECVGR